MNKVFPVSILFIMVLSIIYNSAILHFPAQVLAQKANNINNLRTYDNPTFSIRIQYPSDWKLEENKDYSEDDITVVTFSSPGSEDVRINVENLDDPSTSLTQYANDSILGDLRQSRDFTMLQSNPNAILAGNPAFSVTYTDKDPDLFKGMDIVTIKNGRAYDISYTADFGNYDNVLPTVQTMINSFTITTSPST
jgi:eukaryotic-like serine/threonine-protein kinase